MERFNLDNLTKLVSDGRIFSVEFVKRTTGEVRKMRARLGVTKALRGGDLKYNPVSCGLLTVYDMDRKGYRSIPADAVRKLTVSGQTFILGGV